MLQHREIHNGSKAEITSLFSCPCIYFTRVTSRIYTADSILKNKQGFALTTVYFIVLRRRRRRRRRGEAALGQLNGWFVNLYARVNIRLINRSDLMYVYIYICCIIYTFFRINARSVCLYSRSACVRECEDSLVL